MLKELSEDRKVDTDAKNQLFHVLQTDPRVRRTIRSLSYENSLMEREDVDAEFWRGVAMGMAVVKSNVGDPILHLIQRGIWQVKSCIKSEFSRRVIQFCSVCGHTNGRYRYDRKCKLCAGSVENVGRFVDIDNHDFADQYLNSVASTTRISCTRKLSPQQQHVLEALISACAQGHNQPQVAVAKALGISKQRVAQHIDKIRPVIVLD